MYRYYLSWKSGGLPGSSVAYGGINGNLPGVCFGGSEGKAQKGTRPCPGGVLWQTSSFPTHLPPTHALSTAPHLSPGRQAPGSQIGDSGLPVLVSASRDSQAQSAALSLDQLHHGDAPELLCRQTGG